MNEGAPASAPSSPPLAARDRIVTARSSVYPLTPFNNQVSLKYDLFRLSNKLGSQVKLLQLDENFSQHVQITSTVAWLILFFSVFNSALVPCWLMGNLRSEPFTRNSWRFFMQTMLAIPFLLFEERKLSQKSQTQLAFWTQFTWQNLVRVYKRTLHFMLWLLFYVQACRLTSMNHACHLTNLMTCFFSVIRDYEGVKNHEYERAGTGLVIFGLCLVFYDSLAMPYVDQANDNQLFLTIHPLLRVVGDILAILASFILAYMNSTVPQSTFSPFGRYFISNLFNCFNLMIFGYFFGGSEISANYLYGLFGLFTIQNFVMVFYVSIMLGIGLMLSNILIDQIFSETIRAIAGIFQPLLTSILYHMLELEPIPSGLSCIGFSFIVPGQLMIVAGQSTLHQTPGLINFVLKESRED